MPPNILQRIKRKIEINYEKLQGLDFSKTVSPEVLGLDSKFVSPGSPSGNKYLKNCLSSLNINKNDRILYIGCAKGSVIKYLQMFPFEYVHGIELSNYLSETAIKNFKRLKKNNVKIFNQDAKKFNRYTDYNYFYMYNPFPKVIMKDVLNEIITQNFSNQTLYIVYNNPVCHDTILSSGFLKISEHDDLWGNKIFCYKFK